MRMTQQINPLHCFRLPSAATMVKVSSDLSFLQDQEKQMKEMYKQRELTDFSVHVSDRPTAAIPCHRVMLAASSPVLRAMCTADMKEARTGTVCLDGHPASLVRAMVDYMYGSPFEADDMDLPAALQLAHYLQMTGLMKHLAREAQKHIHPHDAVMWYSLSKQFELKELMKESEAFLKKNFSQVTKETFLELELSQLEANIKLLQYVITPDQMTTAVFEWVSHNEEHRKSLLFDALIHMPLEQCSVSYLHAMQTQYKDLLHPDVLSKLHKAVTDKAVALERAQWSQQAANAEFASKLPNRKSFVIIGGYHKDSRVINRNCWILSKDGIFREFTKLPEFDEPEPEPEKDVSAKVGGFVFGSKPISEDVEMLQCVEICATAAGFAVVTITGGLCYQYDMQSHEWEKLPDVSENLSDGFKIAFHEGKICIMDNSMRWDYVNGRWESNKLDGRKNDGSKPVALVSTAKKLIKIESKSETYVSRKHNYKGEINLYTVMDNKLQSQSKAHDFSHNKAKDIMVTTNDTKIFLMSDLMCASYDTEKQELTTLSARSPKPFKRGHCLVHNGATLYLCWGGDTARDMYIQEYIANTSAFSACNWRMTDVRLPEVLQGHTALLVNTDNTG